MEKKQIYGAVVGRIGTGKSTFINNFLELNPGDENAAKIGEIETTKEITTYGNNNIILSEIPQKCQIENNYDFFVILSQGRFTQEDTKIVEILKTFGKPYFFLRSKIDTDINNGKRRGTPADKIKEVIIDDCLKNLGVEHKDFLFLIGYIDNHSDLLGYQYEAFCKKLKEQVPY